MQPEDYEKLIQVIRSCDSIQWEGDSRSPIGELQITPDISDHLVFLLDNSIISDCFDNETNLGADSSVIAKYLNKRLRIIFFLPIPNKTYAITKNLDDLFKYTQFYSTIPEHIFLIDDDIQSPPQKYKDAVAFANLLKITADHIDEDGDLITCYYYDGVKISVPLRYAENDLKELKQLRIFTESFEVPRLKERVQLFKSALVKTAISSPSADLAFPHLIDNFEKTKNSFEQDWNLYVSDFSMDEILDELEEKILKIADKLSSTLSDLQKTLIAIPLAIIFAAPRIETEKIQTWTNGLIVASVILFALFTWAFFTNHKRSIRFITNEIDETKKLVSEKHKKVADKVNSKFLELDNRCSYQHWYRRIVGSLMWLAVFLVLGFFFSPQLLPLAKKGYTALFEIVNTLLQ